MRQDRRRSCLANSEDRGIAHRGCLRQRSTHVQAGGREVRCPIDLHRAAQTRHGIERVAEFFKGDSANVIAFGFVSPIFKKQGEAELIDELRTIIWDESGTTAYFTFSSQLRPSVHQFRIFGPKNGLFLDQDQETLIKLRGSRFKSYVEKFAPPVLFARQYLRNFSRNL